MFFSDRGQPPAQVPLLQPLHRGNRAQRRKGGNPGLYEHERDVRGRAEGRTGRQGITQADHRKAGNGICGIGFLFDQDHQGNGG